MKENISEPFLLEVLCLPDEIFICYEPFDTDMNKEDLELLQNQSGRRLVHKMTSRFLSANETKIFTKKNEKPEVICDGREISASFSHTTGGVVGAISRSFNVGCDMECADREVHPRLVDRMKHNKEEADLYDSNKAIQIWTLKESALKMIGTGLRKPMRSVRISTNKRNRFTVYFDDEKEAKICSFKHLNHWISVCFQPL